MNSLTQTLDKFESSFGGLRETARFCIAIAAATRLNRKLPLAAILVGGPSSGKTTILMPLTKGDKGSKILDAVLRVDDFTSASLVSHAANRTAEQLEKQDLLPRMTNKCVVVKEMAPLFTGNEDELLRKFGVFASILDGEGYISSSGSHGPRGYAERRVFSLLGAVTPSVLTSKVMRCLDAVGPRFCFWEVPTRELDPETWRGPDDSRSAQEAEASRCITTFIDDLFNRHPHGSVERGSFKISKEMNEKLSHIALLMASLRSRGLADTDDEGNVLGISVTRESPERAYRYLEQIVLGSALSDSRVEINDSDLILALRVAFGSASPARRKVIKALLESPRQGSFH